jgi:hypothetical protein
VAPGSSCVEILAAIMRNINKAWDAQLRAAREQAVAKVINRHRKNEEDASKYKNPSANRGALREYDRSHQSHGQGNVRLTMRPGARTCCACANDSGMSLMLPDARNSAVDAANTRSFHFPQWKIDGEKDLRVLSFTQNVDSFAGSRSLWTRWRKDSSGGAACQNSPSGRPPVARRGADGDLGPVAGARTPDTRARSDKRHPCAPHAGRIVKLVYLDSP